MVLIWQAVGHCYSSWVTLITIGIHAIRQIILLTSTSYFKVLRYKEIWKKYFAESRNGRHNANCKHFVNAQLAEFPIIFLLNCFHAKQ